MLAAWNRHLNGGRVKYYEVYESVNSLNPNYKELMYKIDVLNG